MGPYGPIQKVLMLLTKLAKRDFARRKRRSYYSNASQKITSVLTSASLDHLIGIILYPLRVKSIMRSEVTSASSDHRIN